MLTNTVLTSKIICQFVFRVKAKLHTTHSSHKGYECFIKCLHKYIGAMLFNTKKIFVFLLVRVFVVHLLVKSNVIGCNRSEVTTKQVKSFNQSFLLLAASHLSTPKHIYKYTLIWCQFNENHRCTLFMYTKMILRF